MRRIARILLPVLILCLAGQGASRAEDGGGSVLVSTEPVQRGSLPDIVVAYGNVVNGADSIMTLSLQQDGRVTRIAVTAGEAVAAGQILVEFSSSAQAASRFAEAQTALSLAQQQRRHAGQLLTQHLATRDQLAQAEKTLLDAQSDLDALHREGGGKAVQRLVAPFDGVVQGLSVSRGDRVAAGAPLATLARDGGMIVTAGIEPGLRSRVHAGQAVVIADLRGGDPVPGRLLRLAARLNPRTRLLDVDIALPDLSSMALLAGEAVRAEITVGQPEGWLVPRQAVAVDVASRGHQVPVVYQTLNGRAVRVPVALDVEQGERELVSGGLDPSRPLVIEGVHQLSDGAAIRLRE